MLTAVRFLRSWSCYNAGEIAGFSDEVVLKLMEQGVVEPLPAPVSTPMASEPKPVPVESPRKRDVGKRR